MAKNLTEVHERMCASVFDDMVAHIKEVKQLIEIEKLIDRVQDSCVNVYPTLHEAYES